MAVRERTDVQLIERQLADFMDLFANHPVLEKALVNPAVPVQRKRAIVEELARRAKPVPIVAKLMLLLAERDRLVLLRELLAAYRERLLDHLKVVRAEVTTAVRLPADRTRALEQSLAAVTGRTVSMEARVDPSIIGGVVARIGSTIYDGSVVRQLEKIKERLVESAQ